MRCACTLGATLAGLSLSLALGLPAHAAVLTMATDKSTYAVGETITLTVTGDSQGGVDLYVFGSAVYDPGLVSPDGGQTQNTLTSFEGLIWTLGPLLVDDPPGTQHSFSQLGDTMPLTVDQLLLATMSFTAQATGVAAFSWLAEGGLNTFHFFGLTNAPGTSVTIVPEPATAALLALGLVGLALRARTA